MMGDDHQSLARQVLWNRGGDVPIPNRSFLLILTDDGDVRMVGDKVDQERTVNQEGGGTTGRVVVVVVVVVEARR